MRVVLTGNRGSFGFKSDRETLVKSHLDFIFKTKTERRQKHMKSLSRFAMNESPPTFWNGSNAIPSQRGLVFPKIIIP